MKKNVVKKILSLCFCGILMAGCGGSSVNEDDFQRLQSGLEKNTTMQSTHFDGEILMDMEVQKESMRVKLSAAGDIKGGEQPEANVTMSVAANGIKLEDQINFYFKDQALYFDVMGTQMQIPLDAFLAASLDEATTPKIDETTEIDSIENLKSLDVTEKSDGTHYVLTYKEDVIKKIVDATISGMDKTYSEKDLEMIEQLLTDFIKTAEITYVIDNDGYASTIIATGTFEYTSKEKSTDTMKMEFDMSFHLTDIDKIESIEFPDLSGYPVVDTDLDTLSEELANSDQGL